MQKYIHRSSNGWAERIQNVLRHLRRVPGRRLLDLGCSIGTFTHETLRLGYDTVGVDRSEVAIGKAGGIAGSGDRFSCQDVSRLAFRAETFDGIIAADIFEHLLPSTLTATLHECHRVLKPGALLIGHTFPIRYEPLFSGWRIPFLLPGWALPDPLLSRYLRGLFRFFDRVLYPLLRGLTYTKRIEDARHCNPVDPDEFRQELLLSGFHLLEWEVHSLAPADDRWPRSWFKRTPLSRRHITFVAERSSPFSPSSFESVPCDLCSNLDVRRLYSKPDTRYWISPIEFPVVQCRRCGLAFVSPRPTRAAMQHFYPTAFYADRTLDRDVSLYEKEARFLSQRTPGRLLDIGCASGAFLKLMQDKGWDVFGVEFSTDGGNPYHLPIHHGPLASADYPSDHFDAVTAWAVWEHLHEPMRHFREVARLLKKGGDFIMLVPNLRSLRTRFAYAEDVPRHLYFYSPGTLRRYSGTVGLSLKEVRYSNDIFSGWGVAVFRTRLLRFWGVSWEEMAHPRRIHHRLLSKLGSALGRFLISEPLERHLHLSGMIVASFRKD